MARRWLFAPLVKPLTGLGLAAGAVVFAVAIAALLDRAHEEASVALPPVEDITLSAGPEATCVVRESGAVVCWGENSDGQTDAPSGSFRSVSVGGTGVFGAQRVWRTPIGRSRLLGGQRPRSSGTLLPGATGWFQCGWSSHLRATGIRRDRLLGRKRPWSSGCASRERTAP